MAVDMLEEHWRSLLLERLQRLEALADELKEHVNNMKTQTAVQAVETKLQSDSQLRIERDLAELTRVVREVERKLDKTPIGQTELEKRVKSLEEWQQNLMGRLIAYGSIGMVIFAALAGASAKLFGLG